MLRPDGSSGCPPGCSSAFSTAPLWCLCWGTQMEAVSKTIGIRGISAAGGGGIPGEHRMGRKAPSLSRFELGFQAGGEPTSSPPTARVKNGEEKRVSSCHSYINTDPKAKSSDFLVEDIRHRGGLQEQSSTEPCSCQGKLHKIQVQQQR